MDLSDVIFDFSIPANVRYGLLSLAESHRLSPYTTILKPTAENNDVNGSQHHDFVVYFTYEDASSSDVANASSVGYYEYFRDLGDGTYSGNQYDGSGSFVQAIVIDPPAYASEVSL